MKEDDLYKISTLRQEMEQQEILERDHLKDLHDAYYLALSYGDIENAQSRKKKWTKTKKN